MTGSRMTFTEGRIVRNEGHGPIFYRMDVALPDAVEFVPGQFAMVSGWPGNDPLLPRPLAIFHSAGGRGKGAVEFVYKVVGRGTALLSGLHAGDRLALTLPLGRGFDVGREGRRYLLVGGGVGFSSVFPAAARLKSRKVSFDLFLGARTKDQLPPREWVAEAGTAGRVHLCTDDGTAGFHGFAADALRERIGGLKHPELERTTLLACGPVEMLRSIAALAEERGVEAQVALENHMACGFGVCWGCVVGIREKGRVAYRRVCREGPVFDARDVAW